jgi:hypothetical protein
MKLIASGLWEIVLGLWSLKSAAGSWAILGFGDPYGTVTCCWQAMDEGVQVVGDLPLHRRVDPGHVGARQCR